MLNQLLTAPGRRPQWPANLRWRMDIQTRPDQVARARELGAEIAAAADEIERTRRIPEALLGRLHDARLFRMLLPRAAGAGARALAAGGGGRRGGGGCAVGGGGGGGRPPRTTPRSRGTHSSPTVP